ncbi:MAG TPA: ABC transporter permease [Longimicrobiales bacterium]|nr:ABC transporter permease [Longimicrobiales bacterium]
MSRMLPVLKREFTQAVMTRGFIIGTLLGPLLMAGLFGAQFLIVSQSGGGEHRIAILDASGRALAPHVVETVAERTSGAPSFVAQASYEFELREVAAEERDALQREYAQRVLAKELDGFLWLPPEALAGAGIRYEGSNATNSRVTADLRQGVQRVVQSERLRREGIDEDRLGDALEPVSMEVARTGDDGQAGDVNSARLLAFFMAFAIYVMVIMWGQAILMSVQEEKRDRIVELIVSSIRARDLLLGKVLGIGAAGVLQLTIWVLAAVLVLTYGAVAAALFGAGEGMLQALAEGSMMPRVPLSLGVIFVLFFAGGFFLFATLFAVVGAVVTSTQEAQQFVFPVLMPFLLGFFMAMPAADNPASGVAIMGSLIPFTSPIVMPVRASVGGVEWIQVLVSLALLFATAAVIVWFAAKVYRVAIFATGQKPTLSEIVRWMRAA